MSGSKQVGDLLRPGQRGSPALWDLDNEKSNKPTHNSRTHAILWLNPMHYLKLLLEDRPGAAISCVVLAPTAQFYGWDTAFPEFDAVERTNRDGIKTRGIFRMDQDQRFPGGHRHRICRSTSKNGWPAGQTNSFRMQGAYSRKHLQMLADVAGDKYEWITLQKGTKVSRAIWQSRSVLPPAAYKSSEEYPAQI